MYRTTAVALVMLAQLIGTTVHASDMGIDAPARPITAMPGTGLTLPPVALALPECATAPQMAACARRIEDAAYRPIEPQTRAFA